MQLPGSILSPSSEKKFTLKKNSYISMELSCLPYPHPPPPPHKKKLIKLPCSFRRNWILEQPLLFSGYSSIRFFKVIFCDFRDSHHSHLIFCDFWDTMLEVFTFIPYNLYDLKGTMPHQRSPTTPFRTQRIPRKTENIPSGGMYPNDVPPPTFLAYLQPV